MVSRLTIHRDWSRIDPQAQSDACNVAADPANLLAETPFNLVGDEARSRVHHEYCPCQRKAARRDPPRVVIGIDLVADRGGERLELLCNGRSRAMVSRLTIQ